MSAKKNVIPMEETTTLDGYRKISTKELKRLLALYNRAIELGVTPTDYFAHRGMISHVLGERKAA